MTPLDTLQHITLPAPRYREVVDHCRRKLDRDYLTDEEPERKAYGLLGGRLESGRLIVTHVVPLRHNLRSTPRYQKILDGLMEEVAVPSETPYARRGWVADPAEVVAAERAAETSGSTIFCSYHMHRVAWSHDPLRDTCTAIDTRLAEGSGLWMLIVSMVDPERPILRAFYEGDNDREAAIELDARDRHHA